MKNKTINTDNFKRNIENKSINNQGDAGNKSETNADASPSDHIKSGDKCMFIIKLNCFPKITLVIFCDRDFLLPNG